MKDDNINSLEPLDTTRKKSQKAGLSSVRPDDYTEKKFKDMAKEMDISQTQLFQRIFLNYINVEKDAEKQSALNLESEVNLISHDLNSILQHFKIISEKCQNTIISMKNNSEQSENNLKLEIDTLNKKVEELNVKNSLLKESLTHDANEKAILTNKINELDSQLKGNIVTINNLKNTNADLLLQISTLLKLEVKNKELSTEHDKANQEIKHLTSELYDMSQKIKSLESQKEILKSQHSTLKAELNDKIIAVKDQVRKETLIESKDELLNFKIQYNNLQMENIKDLTTIGNLNKEIEELKLAIKSQKGKDKY